MGKTGSFVLVKRESSAVSLASIARVVKVTGKRKPYGMIMVVFIHFVVLGHLMGFVGLSSLPLSQVTVCRTCFVTSAYRYFF